MIFMLCQVISLGGHLLKAPLRKKHFFFKCAISILLVNLYTSQKIYLKLHSSTERYLAYTCTQSFAQVKLTCYRYYKCYL